MAISTTTPAKPKASRKKKGAAATQAPPVTHVWYVIDQSGSMQHLAEDVKRVFRDQIDALAAASAGQAVDVSVSFFGDIVTERFYAKPIAQAPRDIGYFIQGCTAFFDGVGKAIMTLKNQDDAGGKNVAFLVVVITDGLENASRQYNGNSLRAMIGEVQGTDRWTISVLVPPDAHIASLATRLAIPEGNFQKWELTKAGLQAANVATQAATSAYMADRASGIMKSVSFFTPDLSKIKAKDVNRLADVSDKFKTWVVEKEAAIKDFCDLKLASSRTAKEVGSPGFYEIGRGFYELTKKEKVETQKRILLMERGSDRILGDGPKGTVRDLIGAPKTEAFKFEPGNHGNFRIFVESQSPNRKLVRGSSFLYEKK